MKKLLLTLIVGILTNISYSQNPLVTSFTVGTETCDTVQLFLNNNTPVQSPQLYYRWYKQGGWLSPDVLIQNMGTSQAPLEVWRSKSSTITYNYILRAYTNSNYTGFVWSKNLTASSANSLCVTFSNSKYFCDGSFIAYSNVTGGTSPYTYTWQWFDEDTLGNLIPHTSNQNQSFSGIISSSGHISSQNLNVTVTVTDTIGNTATQSVLLEYEQYGDIFLTVLSQTCDSSLILCEFYTSGQFNNIGTWQFSTGQSSTLEYPIINFENNVPNYAVYNINNNYCNTSDTLHFTPTNSNCLSANITYGNVYCSGNFTAYSNITNGTGPYTYLWEWYQEDVNGNPVFHTSTSQNINYQGYSSINNSISLTVTDANNAVTVTDSIFNNYANLYVSTSDSVVSENCDSTTIQFTANMNNFYLTPNMTWNWVFDDGQTSNLRNPVVTFANTSYMGGNLYSDNGFCDVQDTFNLSMAGNCLTANINLGFVYCAGNFYAFSQVYGGTAPYSYLWEWYQDDVNGNPVLHSSTSTNLNNQDFSSQNNTLILTVTDANGNTVYDTASIVTSGSIYTNASYSVLNSTCDSTTVQLNTYTGSIVTNSWTWIFDDGQSSNIQNPIMTFANGSITGNFTTSNGYCTGSDSLAMNLTGNCISVTLNQGSSYTCGSIAGRVYSYPTVTGGTAPYTYLKEWYEDDANGIPVLHSSTDPYMAIQPISPTNRLITITVTDANGMVAIDTLTATFGTIGQTSANPNITFTVLNSSCDSTTVQFNSGSVPVGSNFRWMFYTSTSGWNINSFGSAIDSAFVQNPIFTYPNNENLKARIYITNGYGCNGYDYQFLGPYSGSFTASLTSHFLDCSSDTLNTNSSIIASHLNSTTVWSDGVNSSIYQNPAPGTYSFTVTENTTGCVDTGSIVVPDNGCNQLYGNVYYDDNGDCMVNGIDSLIPSVWVGLINSSSNDTVNHSYTYNSGSYHFSLLDGTYSLYVSSSPTTDVSSLTQTCPSSLFTVTVNSMNPNDTVNFFLSPPIPIQDLSVSMQTIMNVSPGFLNKIKTRYCNDGTIAMDGSLEVNFDMALNYTNSYPAEDALDLTTNTATYNFVGLQPGQCRSVFTNLSTPSTLAIGTAVNYNATVYPISGDVTPANNVAYIVDTCSASWDPNDKAVYPNGGMTVNQKDHDYTIQFQNQGTANAQTVVVRDVLDDNLDLQTLSNVSSSHNFVMTIQNGNELVFTFNNINLPYEAINAQGSQGYIDFSISQKNDLAIGTVIENTAAIYFDFNAPIITNTTVNVIVGKTTAIEDVEDENMINVYPNPSNGLINIESEKGNKIQMITVFNILGEKVFETENVSNTNALLNLQNNAEGIYILQIVTDKGFVTKKIKIDKE